MSETAAPPTTLGRYQIAEELGSGAMGVVYLGVDPVIARPVAIKVVKQSEHMTPAELEQFHARFRQEAEAAGRLSHPDIVQVYDIGPNYMVMEYVEGRPLSQVLREGASFQVRQILALVQRAADAVDYAHKNGIVHRDIKPGNIMLVGGGLKVMDFGVARLDSSTLTAAGAVVGSVRYMAPEQMMGEKVDGRADIFSLAAVAYELLTAQPPFPGKTITEVVSSVVRGRHVPPSAAAPQLPKALDRAFGRAFAKSAAERYARALDFARDLSDALKPVLELQIVHGAQAEIPTEVDGTALQDGDRTATSAGALAPGPAAEEPRATGGADETVVMSAPALTTTQPASERETLELKAPAAPPPAQPATPATARTVIMDVAQLRREGVLMLESDPPGASLFLDGARVGVTPLPDLEVKFGAHEVRLEAPGCEPAVLQVELAAERPLLALTVSLAPERPQDGSLRPGQFVAFGPEVMPPCRVGGALPQYPPGARERGLSGSPLVELWVGEQGEVMDLAVVESAGSILDGALLDAVSQWRFTPARLRGVPVSVRLLIQHHFRP
jgi:serine/threonine-protein kinase